MDNDKWVWGDEEDSLSLPALDRKPEPIIDWFGVKPEPVAPVDAAETPARAAVEPPVDRSVTVAAPKSPAPRPIPDSVVKAIVLHLEGRLEEALEELRAGLRNGEPGADLYPAMGALQVELERFEDAAASYRESLKLEPENENSKRHLALCEERAAEARKPAPLPPSLVKAIALHQEGKIEEAIKELQRGVKSEPAVELYAALGHLQIETGRYDPAADAYREAIKRVPEHKTCHYNLAVCLEKTARYKEALASYQKAFEIDPQRIQAGIGAGVALLHLKKFAEAVELFETCLKSRPDDVTALFGKAYSLHGLARHGEAEAAYLEALKRDAGQRETLTNLIALCVEQGKDAATRSYCEMLLALDGDSKPALEALLALDLAQGNGEAACAGGQKLTRLSPDSFEAWFNFGVACQMAKRLEHAVAAFAKAVRIRPKSFEAVSSLGQAMQAQGDLASARSAYESALKLSPDHPAMLWNLAEVAEQSGNSREAERVWALLGSRAAKAEAAQFRLGSLRYQRGDFAGAADAFRGCLKARPDWAAAKFNLGLALWKSGNREEARRHMESVGAGPLLADALHSLAAMAAEREDYLGALGYYKKLAEGGERSAELFYNTGLILQNLGRMEEAARQYREAVAVSPELVEASQALARMVNGSGPKDSGAALPAPVAELLKTR